ncbi:hypothetical protein BZL29_6046 [Mycobacterium kansasii]|uniref:Uncharacterized protein n=1 Tax=Mycobacterium kansasii TaxID=1768 RepID=A0A1V3WRF0_MYCKA|nr:hypothetical protein BZL29_6046 [Mycobacterium kansasii]
MNALRNISGMARAVGTPAAQRVIGRTSTPGRRTGATP